MGFVKEKNVDIVMCIDATGSMGPCIENVRRNAISFYKELTQKLMMAQINIDSLRVQVITFRDLECDVDAIVSSEFFELPGDSREFERYLAGITPRGGGDNKESGLEAIYTAMTTRWNALKNGDRQIIILFSDADAIGFTEKRNRTGYPNICDEKKFLDMWLSQMGNYNKLVERNKRLVMFAPTGSIYERLQSKLNRSQFSPVSPSKGLADISFDSIMAMLVNSISAG